MGCSSSKTKHNVKNPTSISNIDSKLPPEKNHEPIIISQKKQNNPEKKDHLLILNNKPETCLLILNDQIIKKQIFVNENFLSEKINSSENPEIKYNTPEKIILNTNPSIINFINKPIPINSDNIKDTKLKNKENISRIQDEADILLNLTKTQNLNLHDENIANKNILNSIDHNDNLLIKFNTLGNSLNNTNCKINESQQNISNIHNPSICEENKSDRISFKFDLTSNYDIASKFDSTQNLSRIKVPYYENNFENYTFTNFSNTNDLNNLTNQAVNEEDDMPMPITLSVRASKFEAMYPIWIEKKKEISFRIFGKWTIDNSFPMCDSNGYIFRGIKDAKDFNPNTVSHLLNTTNSTNYNISANNTNQNINVNNKNNNITNTVNINNNNNFVIQQNNNQNNLQILNNQTNNNKPLNLNCLIDN